MTKKNSNRFSPEVPERAVRMVLEHGGDHASQWAAIGSIASKIGCTGETLRKWVRQAERDRGQRPGLTGEVPQIEFDLHAMIARNKPPPCAGGRTYPPLVRSESPKFGPCSRYLPCTFTRMGLPTHVRCCVGGTYTLNAAAPKNIPGTS